MYFKGALKLLKLFSSQCRQIQIGLPRQEAGSPPRLASRRPPGSLLPGTSWPRGCAGPGPLPRRLRRERAAPARRSRAAVRGGRRSGPGGGGSLRRAAAAASFAPKMADGGDGGPAAAGGRGPAQPQERVSVRRLPGAVPPAPARGQPVPCPPRRSLRLPRWLPAAGEKRSGPGGAVVRRHLPGGGRVTAAGSGAGGPRPAPARPRGEEGSPPARVAVWPGGGYPRANCEEASGLSGVPQTFWGVRVPPARSPGGVRG